MVDLGENQLPLFDADATKMYIPETGRISYAHPLHSCEALDPELRKPKRNLIL